MARVGHVLPVVVAGGLAATWPSIASLAANWREIYDYQHGAAIAAIALAWFIVTTARMAENPARPGRFWTLALGAALLAWLVAFNANSAMAHQMLLPAVLWLAACSATGWATARRLIAPVAFLYFCIPVWEYAVPWLQRMSIAATESALGIAGVPAIVREYSVTIPEGTFRIIEGCSGKRFFMVTLALACLSAAMHHFRGLRAAAYIALSGGLAMLANWLRIFIVIYAGHATGMQHYFVSVEHKTLGNAIFVVLLIAVLAMARLFVRSQAPSAPAAQSPPVARPADGAGQGLLVTMAMLVLATALVQWRGQVRYAAPALDRLPVRTDGWQGPLPGDARWQPSYVAPADESRAAYASEAGRVEVYVNLYGDQRQGSELIFFGNRILAPGDWNRAWPPVQDRLQPAEGPALSEFVAEADDGSTWLVAYGYQVGARTYRSELLVQLAYGLQSILRPAPSGVVILVSRCEPNCEAARALVKSFWGEMSALVLALRPASLDRARDPPQVTAK